MDLENQQRVQHIQSTNIQRLQLYSQLFLYGDFIPLDFHLNVHQIEQELVALKEHWTPYNIQRGDTGRMGLSITSLTGEFGGNEIQSLYQYSQDTGHKVSENDYNKLTTVYDKVSTLRPVLDYFKNDLGRSRFIRMKEGGYFPPHRDHSVSFQVPDYFRLFVALNNTGHNKLFFIFDDKIVNYEPGRIYLFNALKTHTVFSLVPDALIATISLKLTQSAIIRTLARLEAK